jgi:hypothetical protein
MIVFKSLVSKKEFSVMDLVSIKTSFGNTAYLDFKFNHGRVYIMNSVNNLFELVSELKQMNNNIETRGC